MAWFIAEELGKYRLLFKPVEGYWFTWFLVEWLRGRSGCFKATLDIGLSKRVVCVEGSGLSFEGLTVSLDDVAPSSEGRVVLLERSGVVSEVVLHTERGFYKLKAIGVDKAPTLEISGIYMHRITGIDPWGTLSRRSGRQGLSRARGSWTPAWASAILQ